MQQLTGQQVALMTRAIVQQTSQGGAIKKRFLCGQQGKQQQGTKAISNNSPRHPWWPHLVEGFGWCQIRCVTSLANGLETGGVT